VDFLEQWTRYFPSGFIALTGSPGAVRRAADGFDVRYARVETTSTAGYAMSHTADVFLLDAEGQLERTYPFGTLAEAIVADLSRLTAG
jgi:protein SCO1